MHIDHWQIRCFLEVASQGSINGAAKVLHISQSALSRRMSALEHSLGAPLFLRTARGVELTSQGRSLVQRAEGLLQDFGDIQPPSEEPGIDGANFRIGMLSGFRDLLLPSLLQRLSSHALGDSTLFESSMPVLRDQVRKQVLDIAIVGDPSVRGVLVFKPIWRERLFLVMPCASGGAPPAAELPLLMTTEDAALRARLSYAVARSGQRPRRTVTVTPTDVAKQLIRQGVGYSVLPYSMIVDGLAAGWFSATPIDVPWLAVGALHQSNRKDARIETVIIAIRELIHEHLTGSAEAYISLAS